MKRLIYLFCLLTPLFFVGCKKGIDGPTRSLVVLNSSDSRLLVNAEIAADDKELWETRMMSDDYTIQNMPLAVCNVFAFGEADTVQAMIFEYDFSKLDSTEALYFDATGVTPYAIVNAAYLYDFTDYLVKPFKYDATNVATDLNLDIEWHEAGEPFVYKGDLTEKPKALEKELQNGFNLRMLIPMPAKHMSMEEKVAYIDKFLKDLGTAY